MSLLLAAAIALLLWQIGPWALALVPLFWLRRFRPRHPWWASAASVAVLCLAVVGLLVPQDGRFPLPPGAGVATTPQFQGRPANGTPVKSTPPPQHPHLAANGRNSMHNDAAATDAYAGPGPRGDHPQVATASYGIQECATLLFDSNGDLVGLCGDRTGPVLARIDPESLRIRAERRLPPRPKIGGSPLENICGGAYAYLDDRDRVVVAASDRSIKVFETNLAPQRSWSVTAQVADTDCLVALMPDWDGNIWFASKAGVVGYVAPDTGKVTSRDLGEGIVNSLAADRDGIYVVSERALYKFRAEGSRVAQIWRARYDRGTQRKPGQLSQGSGTTPTLLANGTVAITDNAEPRMQVLFLDAATGARRCAAPVFGEDASATENSLVAVGDDVIVENNQGYSGPWSTMLGRAPVGGIARVRSDCSVAWTSPVVAPTSVPKASLATGLLYVYEKPPNWWGVNAWYLTGVDLRTGRTWFRVRTGIGTLANNHYAAVTLSPAGAAYIATLGGLVRVQDRG